LSFFIALLSTSYLQTQVSFGISLVFCPYRKLQANSDCSPAIHGQQICGKERRTGNARLLPKGLINSRFIGNYWNLLETTGAIVIFTAKLTCY
jgi:hypothetical protein